MAGAGVKFNVKADTRAFTAAMQRLQKKGGDAAVQAALKSLGEIWLNSTRQRWNQQIAPDGTPWAPLNPAYAGTAADRNKKGKVTTRGVKKGTKIMQASGQMFASLRYQVGLGQLQLGTNKIQAAAQHFGATILPRTGDYLIFWMGGKLIHAKKIVIPSRPLLGLSASDRAKGLEAIEKVYEADWTGRNP